METKTWPCRHCRHKRYAGSAFAPQPSWAPSQRKTSTQQANRIEETGLAVGGQPQKRRKRPARKAGEGQRSTAWKRTR